MVYEHYSRSVWLSLNFVEKVLQIYVCFDLFLLLLGFIHLTCEEACEKVFLYSDTTDVYFSSQVENQVMGKFELEYIFIEGKAITCSFSNMISTFMCFYLVFNFGCFLGQ